MSNKKIGNSFEEELCQKLFDENFWVHNMAQNKAGQPADVIAVRTGIAHLIDCKVCSNDEFPLSRIEPNQKSAMQMWEECCNGVGWFAMKFVDGSIYMISLPRLLWFSEYRTVIKKQDIACFGLPLNEWIENANDLYWRPDDETDCP